MREKILLSLEVGPSGAVLRTAGGLLFALALRRALPSAAPATAAAVLLAVLFGVKVACAVARRFAGGTPRVHAVWEWRRNLARLHDSYQWRKLLWFGAGILAAGVLAGPRASWELGLGSACLASGTLGEVLWRRKGIALAPPQRA
jgi:hypothetical protein